MPIGIETLSAYAVGIIFAIVVLGFMLKAVKKVSAIFLNTLFGGALFIILNILGMDLAVNFLNILLVGLLGVPGVFIIIIMKLFLA